MRKALKDLTFTDGTIIPAGSTIVAAATGTHMDEEYYENPDIFNPWRFSDMRGDEGEATKHQFVSTSVDYVSFGHGKHAWYVLFIKSGCDQLTSMSQPWQILRCQRAEGNDGLSRPELRREV